MATAAATDGMKQVLARVITVKWKLSRFVHGAIRFPAELLPANTAHVLGARSLSVEFLAGSPVATASKRVCRLFEKVEVTVRVTNIAGWAHDPLVLSILPFQDMERGTRSFRMVSAATQVLEVWVRVRYLCCGLAWLCVDLFGLGAWKGVGSVFVV